MRWTTLYLCFICMGIVGCAGREANPVPIYLPGDENLTCDTFKKELLSLQSQMLDLLPKTDDTLIHPLWDIWDVISPIPEMIRNMTHADRIEYEAFQRRYNRLLLIAREKGCVFSDMTIAPIPSSEKGKQTQSSPQSTGRNEEQIQE
jgi:hypothetical protein